MARSARPRGRGWHKADIVAAVRKTGSTLSAISLGLGLTRSAASRALILPHERVNRAIAEQIGVPPHRIWPQWFDASGQRIGSGSRSRSSQRSPARTAEVASAVPSKHAA